MHESYKYIIRKTQLRARSLFSINTITMISLCLLLSFLLPGLYFLYHLLNNKKNLPLPPGPRGFPILGFIPFLGILPHRTLHDLSKTYGPLMHIRIGSVPTIIASSPEMAEQVLKTHDATFANRAPSEIMRVITYESKGFAFTEYGPYWRHVRKLCMINLLSGGKVGSFRSIREEEVSIFIENLRRAAKAGCEVNITDAVGDVVANIVGRMVLGRKWNNEEDDVMVKFRKNTTELFRFLGEFNFNDFIPVAGVFDFQRVRKRANKLHAQHDEFLEKVIGEKMKEKEKGEVKDFMDLLLEMMRTEEEVDGIKFDRTTVKAVVLVSVQKHLF